MNKFWKDMGIAFTMGMVLPAVLLSGLVSLTGRRQKVPVLKEPIVISETAERIDVAEDQRMVSVLGEDGSVRSLLLNEYLTGVVLAEMPVSFEEEALKAQSVVARTYTMRAKNGTSKHENVSVCTNSNCCQAYIEADAYLEKGGKAEDILYIRQIIEATDDQVLTYDGNLIEATYFSCSGGYTEDAVAVWGTEVPYLRSVESPGEENAAYYTDTVHLSASEFMDKLDLNLAGSPASWISNVVYTDGGGVATMNVGDKTYTGTEIRKLLNLRSTAFSVVPQGETIVIHTRGYGHRVGMSQYGADAMASNGSTYEEILAYYYQGTELVAYAD